MINAEWLAEQLPDLSAIAPCNEGGQKAVFTATHPQDGAVVVKVIKPSTDWERIRREILAVEQVQSPRVPRIIEVGRIRHDLDGDLLWLREQRVIGDSVRNLVARAPFAPHEGLQLALHVLDALAAAERVHIVHRDVKPDNIMRDSVGDYWLLDFGIARHLDLQSLTATSLLGGPGTLGYAPPEQMRNRKRELDGRADLFALAVTVVECITGKQPYWDGARDRFEVQRRVETAALLIPSMSWDTEGRFRDLLAAMGQRRADCRPETVGEALAWMQEIAQDHGG